MKSGLPRLLAQLQQAIDGLTDGQLLARFLATRDEAAFAALLRRHGSMVLSVCRRVLGDFHDAEDAFQATFLVLASKASAVMKRESVGGWLYSVAYHTALAAAKANVRRCAGRGGVIHMPHPEVARDPAAAGVLEWRPLLDRELNRLSEKYRLAVVLCDLEGLPHKEAAQVLGVSPSTVSSRLVRARALLARRLASRGVTLSGGALGLLAADTASAQVPVALASSTGRVAALVAAGQLAATAGPAVVLMKGVMKAMLIKKLRLGVGAILVAATLGAVGFTCRPGSEAWAQDGPQPVKDGNLASGRSRTESEDLRRENEDLRATVRVLLKENRTLEKALENAQTRWGTGSQLPMSLPGGGTPGTPPLASEPATSPRSPDANQFRRSRPEGNYNNLTPAPEVRPAPDLPKPVESGTKVPSNANQSNRRTTDPTTASNRAEMMDLHRLAITTAEQDVEAALKELRVARDAEEQLRAAGALERVTKKLRAALAPDAGTTRPR